MVPAASVRFQGIKFRSQLDARWAAFFSHLGWSYTYLPMGGISPTFLVHGDHPFCVEVTGAITPDDYAAAQHRLQGVTVSVPVVVVGVTPAPYFGGMTAGQAFGVAEGEVVCWDGDTLTFMGSSLPFAREPDARPPRRGVVHSAWVKGSNDVGAVAMVSG